MNAKMSVRTFHRIVALYSMSGNLAELAQLAPQGMDGTEPMPLLNRWAQLQGVTIDPAAQGNARSALDQLGHLFPAWQTAMVTGDDTDPVETPPGIAPDTSSGAPAAPSGLMVIDPAQPVAAVAPPAETAPPAPAELPPVPAIPTGGTGDPISSAPPPSSPAAPPSSEPSSTPPPAPAAEDAGPVLQVAEDMNTEAAAVRAICEREAAQLREVMPLLSDNAAGWLLSGIADQTQPATAGRLLKLMVCGGNR